MSEPLKAAAVDQAYAGVIESIAAVDAAIQNLLLLTPRAEPAEGKKEGPRMFNMDMRDSASRIAGFLKDARLHAFVLAQNIMGFTEEAREAAIANQVASQAPVETAPSGGEVVQGNFPKHEG